MKMEGHVVQVSYMNVYQEDLCILHNVSFAIDKGEFVYLVGRTGSGKTSLLRSLYADLPIREGEVQVAGFILQKIKASQVPFLRRKIGIVFQDFQLLFDRSVADNLLFVLRATGWKSERLIKNRIAEVLMQVGLGTVDNKMPHQLSGGEQQRLAIARALLNEPHILFADEPTGNLDPEVSRGIVQLFLDINKTGTAIFMSTHTHSFTREYPARTLRCMNGVLQDSSKEKITLS